MCLATADVLTSLRWISRDSILLVMAAFETIRDLQARIFNGHFVTYLKTFVEREANRLYQSQNCVFSSSSASSCLTPSVFHVVRPSCHLGLCARFARLPWLLYN